MPSKHSRMGRHLEFTLSMLRCLKQTFNHLPECSLTCSRTSGRKTPSPKAGPKFSLSSYPRRATSKTVTAGEALKVFCRILTKIEVALDTRLRKEQAGFRKERGCVDQIFALRNIIKQCLECSLIDQLNNFKKALDSLQSDTLSKILRHPSED